MNIWLLQASEPMPVVNSGERLFRMGMIAEELNKRGHNITWFSNTFDHFKKEQIYDRDTIVKVSENYLIYLFHAPKYKRNISLSRIINHKVIALKFRKTSKKLEKPDLIYASFPTIDYAEEAVKYGKKNNIPVIVDIRDLWPDIFNHNLPKALRIVALPYIKLMNFKTKKLLKNAFAINANCENVLKWALEKGNRKKDKYDRYFYIGYDKQDDIKIEKDEKMDLNKFNISFFATINNQFDYDKIIDFANKLNKKTSNIVINICGDGPQFYVLKKKIKDIHNIRLLGWTEKAKLTYILKNSKLGLAPYKNTFDFQLGVSNKFAEYISYGLPVIMTSEGYMKSLLEKNKCGIATQDVDKLVDFVVKLKDNKDIYNEMSKNAINLYNQNFVAKDIYEKLVDYLEEVGGRQK